jgi:hypothetical protein
MKPMGIRLEQPPQADAENDFIEEHGWREYAKWHLGIEFSCEVSRVVRYGLD